MINMEYFKTQKGGTGLIHNGFKYMVNRKTSSKTLWRCSDRKCSGRVTTEGTTVKITGEHCHPPNEAKLEAEKLKTMLKSKAKESTAPIPKLYNDMLQEVRILQTENVNNEELISNIQTLPSIKTALYRARRERLPQMPTNRDEISIEGEWSVTSKGKRFLLSTDGDENKIIIFTTDKMLDQIIKNIGLK